MIERLAAPVRERVEVTLKGKAEPVAAYRVTANAPVATAAGRG